MLYQNAEVIVKTQRGHCVTRHRKGACRDLPGRSNVQERRRQRSSPKSNSLSVVDNAGLCLLANGISISRPGGWRATPRLFQAQQEQAEHGSQCQATIHLPHRSLTMCNNVQSRRSQLNVQMVSFPKRPALLPLLLGFPPAFPCRCVSQGRSEPGVRGEWSLSCSLVQVI